VIVDGRAQLRRLEVGRNNGMQAEVITGLSEGERVVMIRGQGRPRRQGRRPDQREPLSDSVVVSG
jgi:hypothetical protein